MDYICLLDFCENSRDDSPVLTETKTNVTKPSESDRQSDAMVVQRAFSITRKVLSFDFYVHLYGHFVY